MWLSTPSRKSPTSRSTLKNAATRIKLARRLYQPNGQIALTSFLLCHSLNFSGVFPSGNDRPVEHSDPLLRTGTLAGDLAAERC